MTTHSCSGCAKCNREMRIALRAFSAGDYATYCRWLHEQDRKSGLRTAGELRTNIHLEDTMDNDYTPPNSYGPALQARATSATPESRFVERYKAERRRDLQNEYAAAALRTAQQPAPRLTAAELASYVPPDPFDEPLKRMKKEQR